MPFIGIGLLSLFHGLQLHSISYPRSPRSRNAASHAKNQWLSLAILFEKEREMSCTSLVYPHGSRQNAYSGQEFTVLGPWNIDTPAAIGWRLARSTPPSSFRH